MTAKTAAKGEFTPGPWKVGTFSGFIDGFHHEAISIWPVFAKKGEVGPHVCIICPANRVTEVDEANARLIALSPEMYQALQDILGSGSIREAERIAFAVLDKLKEETHG